MTTDLSTAPAVSDYSFEIGDREFRLFREIIQGETGIQLKDAKRSLVVSRLGKRLRALDLKTFGEYYELLQGAARQEELRELVNCITTNKTSFFREDAHFRFLRDWLPAVAALRRARSLRIWCAACSTGQEAYTIAMTAREALGNDAGVRILASDIETEVLQTAQKGIYPAAELASVPLHYKKRFFCRGVGKWDGHVQVKPELQKLIEFRHFNLIRKPWNIDGRFDAIFLRNVVIYFDQETQRGIFERLSRILEPDGILFVGSSESLFWLPELFAPVSHAVYRLSDGAK